MTGFVLNTEINKGGGEASSWGKKTPSTCGKMRPTGLKWSLFYNIQFHL